MKKPAAKRQTKRAKEARVPTQQERVAALERKIVAALRRHGAKLKPGSYMEYVGTRNACVCAIGAALLTRASTKHKAVALQDDAQAFSSGRDTDGTRFYDAHGVQRLRDWAVGVVNDGVTKEDLAQMEAGFEVREYTIERHQVLADFKSPFWELGVKLREQYGPPVGPTSAYSSLDQYRKDVELNWLNERRAVLRKELGYGS